MRALHEKAVHRDHAIWIQCLQLDGAEVQASLRRLLRGVPRSLWEQVPRPFVLSFSLPSPNFRVSPKKSVWRLKAVKIYTKRTNFFLKISITILCPSVYQALCGSPCMASATYLQPSHTQPSPPHFARCCLQSFASWGLKKESLADDLKPGCFGEEVFKKKPRFVPIACSQNEHTERIKGLMF